MHRIFDEIPPVKRPLKCKWSVDIIGNRLANPFSLSRRDSNPQDEKLYILLPTRHTQHKGRNAPTDFGMLTLDCFSHCSKGIWRVSSDFLENLEIINIICQVAKYFNYHNNINVGENPLRIDVPIHVIGKRPVGRIFSIFQNLCSAGCHFALTNYNFSWNNVL